MSKIINDKNISDVEEGGITFVEDENIVEFQKRVKHYLKSYEVEMKLSPPEVARILGYTPMNYSRFKLVGPVNKIASIFTFLLNLAKLKNMSLSEFSTYIDNKPIKTATDQLSRSIYPWEINLLSFMNKTDATLRRFFTRRVINDAQQNEIIKERLEVAMTISTLLTYLKIDDLKLMVSIAKDLSKRSEFNDILEEEITDELKSIKLNIIKFMKDKFKEKENIGSDMN